MNAITRSTTRSSEWEMIRWPVLATTILWPLLVTLAGCAKPAAQVQPAVETVAGVRVGVAQREAVPVLREAPGTVASIRTAEIAARAMGTVEDVLVREGDAVKAGQLLVKLDERELSQHRNAARAALDEAAAAREAAGRDVAAAEAQLDVTEKTLVRFRSLREQKAVAPHEFDEVESRQRSAAAALEGARAHQRQAEAAYKRTESESTAAETVLSYARIVAPFNGVIVRRQAEPGMMAAPGRPLFNVEDTSRYRLEVMLDAAQSSGLRRGAKLRVRLDAFSANDLEGTVAELEPGADPLSQTQRVRIDLPPGPALRSGLFGRALFPAGERQAITAPRAALVERGQLVGVYVVDSSGTAHWRVITAGEAIGDRVEILSGLGDGDRVVLNPENRSLDGKRVEAQR
jgi:RND family efflux transporter MFP subunit